MHQCSLDSDCLKKRLLGNSFVRKTTGNCFSPLQIFTIIHTDPNYCILLFDRSLLNISRQFNFIRFLLFYDFPFFPFFYFFRFSILTIFQFSKLFNLLNFSIFFLLSIFQFCPNFNFILKGILFGSVCFLKTRTFLEDCCSESPSQSNA